MDESRNCRERDRAHLWASSAPKDRDFRRAYREYRFDYDDHGPSEGERGWGLLIPESNEAKG